LLKCLSNGKVEGFDTPFSLLEDKTSILFGLVSKLGDKEFKRMMDIATAQETNHLA
jgi:hypothetical protein